MPTWRPWLACAAIWAAACGRSGFGETFRFDATGSQAQGDGGPSGGGDGGPGGGGDGGPGGDAGSGSAAGDAATDSGGAAPSVTVIADTYLEGLGQGPFGSAIGINFGRSQSGGANEYTLLQFDVSSLTVPVTSATLELYEYTSMGTSAMTVEVHRVTQTWDEATANWPDASTGVTWTSGGGGTWDNTVVATATVTPGTYQVYSWNITSLVNLWIGGTTNQGLELLYATSPPLGNIATFASREHTMTAWRPKLVIVP